MSQGLHFITYLNDSAWYCNNYSLLASAGRYRKTVQGSHLVSYIPILLEKRIGEGHMVTVHWVFLHCSISQHCPSCKNYHQLSYLGKSWGGGPGIFKNLRKGRYRAGPGQLELGIILSPGVFVQFLFASLYIDFILSSTWLASHEYGKEEEQNELWGIGISMTGF